jgi:hypothetical protein
MSLATQKMCAFNSATSGDPRRVVLEQNPTDLNREGFPSRANSDSHCVLGKEASTHGQAFIGRFADSGGPGG